MKLIGTIQQVQIQRERLKKGERPNRYYDPTPILVVDALKLTQRGVFGLLADGGTLIDLHHMDHPQTRNRNNANGISFNFVGNYHKIQARFGDHIQPGVGGENIIIQQTPEFDLSMLDTKLLIQPQGTNQYITLEDVMVAAPCREFSCFVYGEVIDGDNLRNTLEYLSDGTRGFYATLSIKQSDTPIIQAGDKVYIE
ncbi:MAG: hypothetical protein Kow00117_12210 [Phototrophicales bacterium]